MRLNKVSLRWNGDIELPLTQNSRIDYEFGAINEKNSDISKVYSKLFSGNLVLSLVTLLFIFFQRRPILQPFRLDDCLRAAVGRHTYTIGTKAWKATSEAACALREVHSALCRQDYDRHAANFCWERRRKGRNEHPQWLSLMISHWCILPVRANLMYPERAVTSTKHNVLRFQTQKLLVTDAETRSAIQIYIKYWTPTPYIE